MSVRFNAQSQASIYVNLNETYVGICSPVPILCPLSIEPPLAKLEMMKINKSTAILLTDPYNDCIHLDGESM